MFFDCFTSEGVLVTAPLDIGIKNPERFGSESDQKEEDNDKR